MQIPLTNTDKFVLIDDEDFDALSQYSWSCDGNYAVRYTRSCSPDKKVKKHKIYMHRAVMNAPKGLMVDHKNRNTYDNRKENLRLCNKSQNAFNSKKRSGNYSSKHKGVYYSTKENRWVAHCKLNGRKKHIGQRKTEIEAARLYNEFVLANHKEFAVLNDV